MKPENESHWKDGKWSKTQGWTGPSLTYLAGLYSAFESKKVLTTFNYIIQVNKMY